MSATTLAFSRVCRTTASRYATRSLGTEALASSDSTSATLPPRGSATSKARPPSRTIDRFTKSREVPRGYSVYVRPWDHIDGMPAFLAMVRALEKQFGRVREFRVPRVSLLRTSCYMHKFPLVFPCCTSVAQWGDVIVKVQLEACTRAE